MDPLTTYLIGLCVSATSDAIRVGIKGLFERKPNATSSDVKKEITTLVGNNDEIGEKIFNFLQNTKDIVIQGHFTVGNNNTVTGNVNVTNGDRNINIGSQNEVTGHDNVVISNNRRISGHGNTIIG